MCVCVYVCVGGCVLHMVCGGGCASASAAAAGDFDADEVCNGGEQGT